MSTHLIGGGWDEAAAGLVYGPFLKAAGDAPTVAVLLMDEGDGAEYFARFERVLRRTARCTPVPVLVPLGGVPDLGALDGADALLIGGGLTPAYQDALGGLRTELPALLAARGLPYAGFSAGAAVAAGTAVVGGWRSAGVPICPEETGEDLEEIELRPGLGLVPFTVDVHAAQWGTLPRLIEAVARGGVRQGVAIDENTVLTVDAGTARVSGTGRVHLVQADGSGVGLRAYRAGESFAFD
ncbi:Type 1 glutamine amidotransferase-like domain-containing protein [Kitasatospora kazusensis]|uniref:Type 1 glutamine amidotransferase-like domain-containing protein n=1 Tax=Kitasatospora kazusensis TaxID=407974 RepID=UPI0031D3D92A